MTLLTPKISWMTTMAGVEAAFGRAT